MSFLTGVGGTLYPIIMIGGLLLVFYFFMIRPQRKQERETQAMRNNLAVGDEIVTIGGIHGIVRDVQESTVLIEVSPSVTIKMEKVAIARVKSK